jgi:hypothetical protein
MDTQGMTREQDDEVKPMEFSRRTTPYSSAGRWQLMDAARRRGGRRDPRGGRRARRERAYPVALASGCEGVGRRRGSGAPEIVKAVPVRSVVAARPDGLRMQLTATETQTF